VNTKNNDKKFVRISSIPLLSPLSGTFYAEGATTADVLEFQQEILMFFGGLSAKHERIGLASVEKDSFEGTSWTKWFSMPIVDIGDSSDFDSLHVTDPASVVVNNQIYLYYSGIGKGEDAIGLSISDNGRVFFKSIFCPVIRGRAPEIVLYNGRFYLFFVRENSLGGYSIYLNVSDDGILFSGAESRIVLTPTPGSWDGYSITTPRIIKTDDLFMMIYAGDNQTRDQPKSFGLAYSEDLENWSKYGNNPVFTRGKPGSWDDQAIWFGTPYICQGRTLMLYEGCQKPRGHEAPLSQIGIAEMAMV
jgi:hypothetical protein